MTWPRSAVHVGRRGLEVDRCGQVSGAAGPRAPWRFFGPRRALLGREVQGQLVGDGPQGVAAAHRGQGGIIGGGDGGVHGSSSPAWRPRRSGWTWRPPAAAARPLRGGQVGGQGVGGQIRGAGQPRHLGLQGGHGRGVRGHSGGVGANGRSVRGRVRQRRVGGQHGGQLAGRDAGDLGGPPLVEDVPGRLE